MKKIVMSAVALTAIIGSASSLSASEDGVNIFNDIKVKGEIRPRYEYANVDKATSTSANAFTSRLHLTVTSGLLSVEGLSATVGVQSVNNFGYTNYNLPGSNANTDSDGLPYDVINDPNVAMLSEASLDYTTGGTTLHAGRSQVNLDNQRFIGTVGWRQLERSYDTVYAANNSIEGLSLLGAYVYGFAGVGGVTTTESNSVLLNVKYKVADALVITAYDYMLNSPTKTGPYAGNDTIGLSLTGKVDLGAKITYRAEYAIQNDATMDFRKTDATADNFKADANYFNLDLAANFSGFIAGLNYEHFSGSESAGTTTFNPALGTNHKFNGWADIFFVGNAGPDGGLNDANLRLGYKTKGFGKLLAVYHNFQADEDMAIVGATGTTTNLGSEIDVVYANKIPGVNGLTGLVKYASYSAGGDETTFKNTNQDKQVAWLQLDYKF